MAASALLVTALAVVAGCGDGDSSDEAGTAPVDGASGVPVDPVTGFEWTDVDLDVGLSPPILPLGGEYVATMTVDGGAGADGFAVLATSADGATWTEVSGLDIAPDEMLMLVGGSPWGAVWRVETDEGATDDLVVTRDGVQFDRFTLNAATSGALDMGAALGEVGERGVVVLTAPLDTIKDSLEASQAMFTEDLQTWEQVDIDRVDMQFGMGLAVSEVGYLIAAGPSVDGEPMRTLGYFSSDGRGWEAVPVPDNVQLSAIETVGRWPGGGFVVAAWAASGPDNSQLNEGPPGKVLLTSSDGQTWFTIDMTALDGLRPAGGLVTSSSLGLMSVGEPEEQDGPGVGHLYGGSLLAATESGWFFTGDGETWRSWNIADQFGPGVENVNIVMGEDIVVVQRLTTDPLPSTTQFWIGTPTRQ